MTVVGEDRERSWMCNMGTSLIVNLLAVEPIFLYELKQQYSVMSQEETTMKF